MKKWYIIHTTPGYENKVSERLEVRLREKEHMREHFEQILIPTEDVSELKNGQKVTKTRRLYSGYVFIKMAFSDEAWHLVRKIPNVTGFVGGDSKPTPMPQKEIDLILNRVSQTHEKPVPKTVFNLEESIRIISGPFKDFNGTVNHVDYDKAKLRVLVSVFGRETPLEIGFSDVEKS